MCTDAGPYTFAAPDALVLKVRGNGRVVGDVGVGLLEARVLAAGQRQIACHVQAVPATGGPAVHQADDDLRHEPDQPLHLEDVQPPGEAGSTVSAVSPAAY